MPTININNLRTFTFLPNGSPIISALTGLSQGPAYVGGDINTQAAGGVAGIRVAWIYYWVLTFDAIPAGVDTRFIAFNDPVNPPAQPAPGTLFAAGQLTSLVVLGLTAAEGLTVTLYNATAYFDPNLNGPGLGGTTYRLSNPTSVTINPLAVPGFAAPANPGPPTITVGSLAPISSPFLLPANKLFTLDQSTVPATWWDKDCSGPVKSVASWPVTISAPPAIGGQNLMASCALFFEYNTVAVPLFSPTYTVQLPFSFTVVGVPVGNRLVISATNELTFMLPAGQGQVISVPATATINGAGAGNANVPAQPAAPVITVGSPLPINNPNVTASTP